MIGLNTAASSQKANKPLMNIAGRTLSYGEQWSRLHALKGWIQQQSLQDDTPILLAVSDVFEQASLLLALIVLGKPPLIIDPGSTPVEAATILSGSSFSGIIAESGLSKRWGLETFEFPCLTVAGGSTSKGVFGSLLKKRNKEESESTWPAFIKQNPIPFDFEAPSDSLAYVIFTSGTTTKPKGVEITRSALAAQMSVLHEQFVLDSNSRILNTLPLYHVDGTIQGPLLSWVCGGTWFRPMAFSTQALQQYMDGVYRDQITHLIAVPTMLSLMDRFGQEWRDSFSDENFQMIVSCAGHLEQPLWERLESTLGVKVVNLFGLSETVTSALISGFNNETRRVGTIGKPVNSQIRIIDEQGCDVTPGEQGELLINSNQIMRGYHNNPGGTAEVLRDGWLHSGDLVTELETGHVKIVGRKKNQIISGGRNISPEEVASCLNQHPGVIESVVFGQLDADWGEQVVAAVVADKAGLDETGLTEWCRVRLSEYKIPKHILIVDHLEKGPSGKIRIEAARRLFEHGVNKESEKADSGEDIESQLLALAADTFRLQKSDLNSNSGIENTSGWDSLGHLSLLLAAENLFSIKFSAREIMQIDSIRKLTELCSGKVRR